LRGWCARQFVLPRLSIVDKLHLKLVEEEINRTSIIDGILDDQRSQLSDRP